jgi:hypothetical protein
MASVTAADTVLHHVQTEILTQVQGNTKRAVLAVSGTLTGFEAVPVGLAAGVTADKAPHANLAEIGVIFNGAADLASGGINSSNLPTIQKDFTAIYTDLKQLIADDLTLFGDRLHLICAETILNQISLQVNDFDAPYGVNVDAARSTDDNILDIIDIIHGDPSLDNNANQGGVNGRTEFPINANNAGEYLSDTINLYQEITQALSMAHSTAAGTNGGTPQTTNGTPAGGQTTTSPASTPSGGGTYGSPPSSGNGTPPSGTSSGSGTGNNTSSGSSSASSGDNGIRPSPSQLRSCVAPM